MKTKLVFFLVLVVIISGFLASIIPMPLVNRSFETVALSEKNSEKIKQELKDSVHSYFLKYTLFPKDK